ncbi:hypothetical protein [Streptomyces sp. NPDC096152]|uniref:hypothetical protein n=1 Tax=Streptomyces sp. NPDC096152 TaxID=3366078 RepID=UPI0038229D7F
MSASLYESHVTVRCDSSADSERLTGWAAAAGLKLTRIELARGRMRSQPMLTLTGARSYDAARTQAESVAARLRADGFAPVRVKTESAPWAPEVPAEPCGGAQYFEHHVKLRPAAGTDLDALAARVVPHGAHLSWNARRALGDGRHERFVTVPGEEVTQRLVFDPAMKQYPNAYRATDPARTDAWRRARRRVVHGATPALSLAWKMMWLINDAYAQGKDLYDAVLLAERHPLPYELLRQVFELSGEWPYPDRKSVTLDDVVEMLGYVEWNHFVAEYPQHRDDEQMFVDRLVRAVAPTFEGGSQGVGAVHP